MSYVVNFRGKSACPCLAEWLPVYEAELLRRGVIKQCIDIYQLIGGAPQSGGTHTDGGAFDIAQTTSEAIVVARQMGADATWHRPEDWDSRGGIEHTHGVLRGCPHNGPARYQYDSTEFGVDHGRDGLSYGGRGRPDTGPKPLSKRTWKQGIQWARAQQALAAARERTPLEKATDQLRDSRDALAPIAEKDNRPKAKEALSLVRRALRALRGK